jgi:xylan 1,4-beta-xylosidase
VALATTIAAAVAVIAAGVWAGAACAAAPVPGAPAGRCLTASACAVGDTVQDADAIDGTAATSDAEYHDLVAATLPEAGDAFTIWVHRKGGPIQLKAVLHGAQQERQSDWGAPEDYEWCSMGRYERAELGHGITIVRGGKQNHPAPRIDCIVLSPDPAAHPQGMKADGGKELPPEAPDPSVAPTIAEAQINWDKTVGRMVPSIWGVNDCEVVDAQAAASPGYQSFLGSLRPTLIRVHDSDLTEKWTDPETRTWRAEEIKAGFAASTGFGNARIVLCVPSWPGWLAEQSDGTLTPEGEAEFVKLVGQLVRVMRDEVRRPVAYWELLNERDEQFEKLGKLDALWRLLNRLFAEIKRQDPEAKAGGPAFTWPRPLWVESFLKVCGPQVDFVTWHNYASGDIYDPNESVFERVDALTAQARYVKDAVAKAIPDRRVECFLDEYNIKWSWDPIERRHGNNVGAVFQACLLRRLGLLGIDGVMVWHSKGGAYGLIDSDNTVRLTGRLYQMGSRCLVGSMAETSIQWEKNVELLAVRRADGIRSVLLINRANHTVILRGAGELGFAAAAPAMIRLAADGLTLARWKQELAGDELRLPGYSVTLVTDDRAVSGLLREAD